MRKCFFVVFVFLLLMGVGVAEPVIIGVSDDTSLIAAVNEINKASTGEYVISLDNDITMERDIAFTSKVEKTIVGNGKKLILGTTSPSNALITDDKEDDKYYYIDGFIIILNGILNLGDGKSELTITSTGSTTDSSSAIQVVANDLYDEEDYKNPVLNMNEGVTISNWHVDNSYGAGVRVYSHYLEKGFTATFNMRGGTISDCGFTSGSNQFGGGVAVLHNGEFNMEGGTITHCKANNGGGVCLTLLRDKVGIFSVNNPVFKMSGGVITDNSTYKNGGKGGNGGGVAVFNGKLEMTGGSITNNSAWENAGGGIWNADSANDLEISGAEITGNYAYLYGGGIYSTHDVTVENSTIMNNTGYRGGGVYVVSSINKPKFEMKSGVLCNNIGELDGSDAYVAPGAIILPSASGMNKTYRDTGYPIDGWYWDYNGERWVESEAKQGNRQVYQGDSIDARGQALIAAFTAHRDIKITKDWNDANNSYNTRPEKIKFTLKQNGNTVKLTNYDGVEMYAVTEMSKDENTAIIGPLAPNFDITGCEIVESPEVGYSVRSSEFTFTPDTNNADGIHYPVTGTYSTTFTNTWPHLITVYNIWDDADNSNLRPDKLEISLEKNGTAIKDVHGNPATAILSANNWQHTFVLSSSEAINGLEIHEDVPGYSQIKNIYLEGAGINAIVINKREHVAANVEATNESMVNITYNVEKEWSDGKYTVDHPEITIRLFADGTFVREQKLSVSATSYTFTNLPKYKDNNSDTLVTYTIAEEINDENWVKIENEGNTYWYSLDGIGRYSSNVLYGFASNTMIQNTYEVLQEKGYVEFTKRWKDDKNENGVRPASIQIGLFENAESQTPISINGQSVIIEMTSADPDNKAERWVKTAELPLYNEQGIQVDYSRYVVKEWNEVTNTWMNSGESIVIRDLTGREYEYKMSEGD